MTLPLLRLPLLPRITLRERLSRQFVLQTQRRATLNHISSHLKEVAGLLGFLLGHVLGLLLREGGREGGRKGGRKSRKCEWHGI